MVAPFALVVAGTWNATFDGRYLLRRGDAVVGDACKMRDGVFWEHESNRRLTISGTSSGSPSWFLGDREEEDDREGWSYRADIVGCDPAASAWSAHPDRVFGGDGTPPAPSVEAALADCYSHEKKSYEYEYPGFVEIPHTEFRLCNSPVLLFTKKELVKKDDLYEWIPGFCEDASNETSASACLDLWCSQGAATAVPRGDGVCSHVGTEPYDAGHDDESKATTKSFNGGFGVIAVLALVVAGSLIAHCGGCCETRCKRKVMPKEYIVDTLEIPPQHHLSHGDTELPQYLESYTSQRAPPR